VTLPRLTADTSTLLVIDVQDKLLVKMPDAAGLVRDLVFLVDVAKLLGVPILATEQYPKGLGPTVADLTRRLLVNPRAKMTFSSCGAPGLLEELRALGRRNIVVAGMESHVCVMQTALDLVESGWNVFLPVDAVQARFPIDHDLALRRLENAGATLSTAEATAFEWLGNAEHPQFKAVSKLIQERMAALKQ
jgi:nicotinamidase-related amidase